MIWSRHRLLCMISTLAAAALPMVALAGLVVEEDADGIDGLTVFRMTVTPAAEPHPALKHRMWLRPHKLKSGNAATHYMRCYAENTLHGTWKHVRKKFGEAVDDWYSLEISLDQLPMEQVREAAQIFEGIVRNYIQPATRCRDCDWGSGFEDQRGPAIIEYLLPEFQQSRSIARTIALLTRLAIAEGRYDDAIEYLRMNYRLGHDVGREKILVCNLVGIAINGVTNKGVLDLIAAPDSPNLYWALAEVPTPLVDCRESVRLEMTLGPRMYPPLLDAETTEHSDKEWARLVAVGIKIFEEIAEIEHLSNVFASDFQYKSFQDIESGLRATGISLLEYPAAKERLIDSGMEAAKVEMMAVGQVMLIDAAREYQRIADEYEKWWYVPYPIARYRMREAEKQFAAKTTRFGLGQAMARTLLPALEACRHAQTRMGWQKNALLTIEALRMHAAAEGEFPVSLADIRIAPVPLNPITRQPYIYRLKGNMAVLELPFSDGMPGMSWRFEIQLAE